MKSIPAERICKSCLSNKPIQQFHFYNSESPSYKCKECHTHHERARQKALWANNPEYRERHNSLGKMYRKGLKPITKPAELSGNEKICKKCFSVKHAEEFPKIGSRRLHTCKDCYRKQENLKYRIRYRDDPEFRINQQFKANKSRWKYKYGVTPEEVFKTLEDQHSICANDACGTSISLDAPKAFEGRAVIDHNHETGKFRALLCDRCNILLGHIEKIKG